MSERQMMLIELIVSFTTTPGLGPDVLFGRTVGFPFRDDCPPLAQKLTRETIPTVSKDAARKIFYCVEIPKPARPH